MLQTDRGHVVAQVVSWLAWLLIVLVFAIWTLAHYTAPAEPQWVGMTIHTAVFAIWTLVARTWLSIYLVRRWGSHSGSKLARK